MPRTLDFLRAVLQLAPLQLESLEPGLEHRFAEPQEAHPQQELVELEQLELHKLEQLELHELEQLELHKLELAPGEQLELAPGGQLEPQQACHHQRRSVPMDRKPG